MGQVIVDCFCKPEEDEKHDERVDTVDEEAAEIHDICSSSSVGI